MKSAERPSPWIRRVQVCDPLLAWEKYMEALHGEIQRPTETTSVEHAVSRQGRVVRRTAPRKGMQGPHGELQCPTRSAGVQDDRQPYICSLHHINWSQPLQQQEIKCVQMYLAASKRKTLLLGLPLGLTLHCLLLQRSHSYSNSPWCSLPQCFLFSHSSSKLWCHLCNLSLVLFLLSCLQSWDHCPFPARFA